MVTLFLMPFFVALQSQLYRWRLSIDSVLIMNSRVNKPTYYA